MKIIIIGNKKPNWKIKRRKEGLVIYERIGNKFIKLKKQD